MCSSNHGLWNFWTFFTIGNITIMTCHHATLHFFKTEICTTLWILQFTVTQDYFKMKWKIEKTCRKGEAPRARSGHRIVYYNGQIFTFGGYNPESTAEQLFKELWKFNLITKTWQSIKITGDIPNTLASHTARFCMIEGKPTMIVYGGTGHNFGENNSNFTNLCDLSTGHWTTLGKIFCVHIINRG